MGRIAILVSILLLAVAAYTNQLSGGTSSSGTVGGAGKDPSTVDYMRRLEIGVGGTDCVIDTGKIGSCTIQ